MTIITSLHDLIQAYRYAEKVVFLNYGKIYAMGGVDDVMRMCNSFWSKGFYRSL